MALDPKAILQLYAALGDQARTLGVFDTVNGAEPDNPPGRGLSCSIMLGPLGPLPRASGLAATSTLIEFTARIEVPRSKKDPEQTDRDLLYACLQLMGAYSAGFQLDAAAAAAVRNIDLLGAYGPGLSMKPGWITAGEVPYRMADISLPIVLNDTFAQEA